MTNDSDRGLASADKETRERVAREGGKASHGGGRDSDDQGSNNNMTREEAAAKGGRASHSGGRKD